MKLNKEKKIYGAVLGIAVAALAADRLFGAGDPGGPSEASASMAGISASFAATPSSPAGSVVSVAEQLQLAAQQKPLDTTHVNNAFGPWKAEPKHADAAASPAAVDTTAEQFRQAHHLTGVMIAGARAFAIVDGNTIPVGKSIDGIKLVSVTQRSATWRFPEGARFGMSIETAHPAVAR